MAGAVHTGFGWGFPGTETSVSAPRRGANARPRHLSRRGRAHPGQGAAERSRRYLAIQPDQRPDEQAEPWGSSCARGVVPSPGGDPILVHPQWTHLAYTLDEAEQLMLAAAAGDLDVPARPLDPRPRSPIVRPIPQPARTVAWRARRPSPRRLLVAHGGTGGGVAEPAHQLGERGSGPGCEDGARVAELVPAEVLAAGGLAGQVVDPVRRLGAMCRTVLRRQGIRARPARPVQSSRYWYSRPATKPGRRPSEGGSVAYTIAPMRPADPIAGRADRS